MRWNRIGVAALGGVLVALPVILFYQKWPDCPWFADCLIHRLTGFSCPGCGMTRVSHAALHGHLLAALRFNCLGMLLMPVLLLGVGSELFGWMRDKPPPVSLRFGRGAGWWLLGVVLAFWVLRNIPVWPLTLLVLP